jgi:uncharacterized protein
MAARSLIDTGPMIAILDDNDHRHEACVEAFDRMQLPLMTSVAVFAELFYLLGRARVDKEAAWTLLRSGAITIGPITDVDLPHLHSLMSKYGDQPMDFADATLVHLARRESIDTILTLDRDFETYRIEGRKGFNILPAGDLR